MSEHDEIISVLARMRDPLLEAHPEKITACVSCPVECALELEKYQASIRAQLAVSEARCARLREALGSIEWVTGYLDGSKDHARADRALVESSLAEDDRAAGEGGE